MLGEHPIDVVVLARDLPASKDFYSGKVGLEILSENQPRDHVQVRRRQPPDGVSEHHWHGRRTDAGVVSRH